MMIDNADLATFPKVYDGHRTWFTPFVDTASGMVGYIVETTVDNVDSGPARLPAYRTIYLNPSTTDSSPPADDYCPNVFVYIGPHADPASDGAVHHFNLDEWEVG